MRIKEKEHRKIEKYKIDKFISEYYLKNKFGTLDIPNFIDFLPENYKYSYFQLSNPDMGSSFNYLSHDIEKFKKIIIDGDLKEGIETFSFIINENIDNIAICYTYGDNILTIKKDAKNTSFNEDEFAQYFDDIVGQSKKRITL